MTTWPSSATAANPNAGVRAADLAWPHIGSGASVLVPLGSVEQHGPHLPIDTDTVIAKAVCDRLATQLSDDGQPVYVLPAVEYGASGEHQDFPGTVSIGHGALELLLLELGRSLTCWASRVLLVTGHGGNLAAMRRATATLRYETRDVSWLACGMPDWDAHAGFAETSLMLHLDPQRVQLSELTVGNTRPMGELMPLLRAHGVRAASENGVLGDPRAATAADGSRLLDELIGALVQRVCPRESAGAR